jgi:hypothetical protein
VKQDAKRNAEQERERLWSAVSVVYFIGNRNESLVKIGYTTSLGKRLKTIQTSTTFSVTVLHAEPGTPDDERALHRRFAHFRKHGEWFWLKPPIEEYIQEHHKNDSRQTFWAADTFK